MVGGLRRLLAPESFPRRLARYILITLRQAHEDSIWLIASALALVTLLSLIPLLAAFSFIGARVFSQYEQRSLEVFVQILPYSEKTVVDTLSELLGQAGGIHGVGVVFFFLSSLFLFATVEETLNRIWNVSHRRPLRVRFLSFALFSVPGPDPGGGHVHQPPPAAPEPGAAPSHGRVVPADPGAVPRQPDRPHRPLLAGPLRPGPPAQRPRGGTPGVDPPGGPAPVLRLYVSCSAESTRSTAASPSRCCSSSPSI